MSVDVWQKNTAQAVINILDGLAESDWVAAAGDLAWKELVQYRLDMAISVWEGWFNTPNGYLMTDVDRKAIAEILDKRFPDFKPDAPRFTGLYE